MRGREGRRGDADVGQVDTIKMIRTHNLAAFLVTDVDSIDSHSGVLGVDGKDALTDGMWVTINVSVHHIPFA